MRISWKRFGGFGYHVCVCVLGNYLGSNTRETQGGESEFLGLLQDFYILYTTRMQGF